MINQVQFIQSLLILPQGGIQCIKVNAYIMQELEFTNMARIMGGVITYNNMLNKQALMLHVPWPSLHPIWLIIALIGLNLDSIRYNIVFLFIQIKFNTLECLGKCLMDRGMMMTKDNNKVLLATSGQGLKKYYFFVHSNKIQQVGAFGEVSHEWRHNRDKQRQQGAPGGQQTADGLECHYCRQQSLPCSVLDFCCHFCL